MRTAAGSTASERSCGMRFAVTLLMLVVGLAAHAAVVSPWQLSVTNHIVVGALATDSQGRAYVAAGDDGVADGRVFDLVTRLLPHGGRDPDFEVTGLAPGGGVY